jgi:uncharacterized protein YecE (DUF72 family)
VQSADRLTFYAGHFDTVEIDSTFYACPSVRTVEGWALKTPENFIFSVKVPCYDSTITDLGFVNVSKSREFALQ